MRGGMSVWRDQDGARGYLTHGVPSSKVIHLKMWIVPNSAMAATFSIAINFKIRVKDKESCYERC